VKLVWKSGADCSVCPDAVLNLTHL